MAFPKIGDLAPAFSLKNQDGKTVSLKDFKGGAPSVLYFYPAAMTPAAPCRPVACATPRKRWLRSMPWRSA